MRQLLRIVATAAISIGLMAATSAGSDLSVAIITAPLTGCVLGSSEEVTLKFFNHGATLPTGTRFEASYSINAAEAVLEKVTLAAPLPTNAVLTYTFNTVADLSVAGTYHIDASVRLAGDTQPANNMLSGHVATHFAASSGGTVSGPETAYSGTLTLIGAIGSVRQWQQSTSSGERWETLEGNTTSLVFDALTRTTQFRAEVKNGVCDAAYSDILTINPN